MIVHAAHTRFTRTTPTSVATQPQAVFATHATAEGPAGVQLCTEGVGDGHGQGHVRGRGDKVGREGGTDRRQNPSGLDHQASGISHQSGIWHQPSVITH